MRHSKTWRRALAATCALALLCASSHAARQDETPPPAPPASLAPAWKALRERSVAWQVSAVPAGDARVAELERWTALPRVERDLWLESCALNEVLPEDRSTALYVLAHSGAREDVPAFCAIGERAFARGDDFADACVERGVQRWVARDAALLGSLASVLPRATPELRCAAHLGVARGAGDAALEYLANRLGISDAEDRLILGLAGALARTPPAGPPQRLIERARAALRRDDSEVRREAALALGRLEDADAADELASLLESPTFSDRHAASWALTQITGLALAPQAQLWRAWLDAEREFWDDTGEELLADIEHMNRSQQADALRELAQHPWRRAQIARGLAPLLEAQDPKVARLTACVLADLGGSAAHDALRAAAAGAEELSAPLREILPRLEPGHGGPRRKKTVGARDSSRRPSADR